MKQMHVVRIESEGIMSYTAGSGGSKTHWDITIVDRSPVISPLDRISARIDAVLKR